MTLVGSVTEVKTVFSGNRGRQGPESDLGGNEVAVTENAIGASSGEAPTEMGATDGDEVCCTMTEVTARLREPLCTMEAQPRAFVERLE